MWVSKMSAPTTETKGVVRAATKKTKIFLEGRRRLLQVQS
jgi:hypothetical protein